MGEHVLVTGGAGFIGSHLVDALLARGDRVRVLDNLLPQAHPTGKARYLDPEAELVVGDLRNPRHVAEAVEGVSTVFHLGGIVGNGQSMWDLRRYTEINVVGTATLMEAIVAKRAEIRRLVVASSMVVYGDGAYRCSQHGGLRRTLRPTERLATGMWEPVCPTCGEEVEPIPTREDHELCPNSTYGVSKLGQEQLTLVIGRTYSIPTVALRFLNVYGSRQVLSNPYTGVAAIITNRLANNKPPVIFEDGGQRRDFVHVSDVARANIAAADAGEAAFYRPFNIGTGRSVTVLDIVRSIARGLGTDIAPTMDGEFREGDIRHCFADVRRARDLLGWQARVSFADGAAKLVEWAQGEEVAADQLDAANAELRKRGVIR